MLRQAMRILLQLIPGSDLRHWITEHKYDRFRPRFVRPGFQITIDGFPRSANSWIYFQVQLAFPRAKVAHHVHSWQQFLFSHMFRVPSIILIRHPDDSVQSLTTKRGGSMALSYLDYMVTNGLGYIFASHARLFDDLVLPGGMEQLVADIAAILETPAVSPDPAAIEELMESRVHPKNVQTPPFRENELGPVTQLLRRAAHRLYFKLRSRSILDQKAGGRTV